MAFLGCVVLVDLYQLVADRSVLLHEYLGPREGLRPGGSRRAPPGGPPVPALLLGARLGGSRY